MQFLQYKKKI